MEKIFNTGDTIGERRIELVLENYEMLINQKKPMEAAFKYLVHGYIQHNPIVPTDQNGVGKLFEQVVAEHPNARIVVHKLIAAGDYVWTHVNFINIFNNDPDDRGVAGVDIFHFNADGSITEHWDVLQQVPDPATAANTNGMFEILGH